MIKKDFLIAHQLKEKLSRVVTLVDVKIFGSRVKDTQTGYSDMDVFIEVEFLNKELKERIYEIAWEVGLENSMVISTLIFTRDEVENSPLRASPILKNISNEGVKI